MTPPDQAHGCLGRATATLLIATTLIVPGALAQGALTISDSQDDVSLLGTPADVDDPFSTGHVDLLQVVLGEHPESGAARFRFETAAAPQSLGQEGVRGYEFRVDLIHQGAPIRLTIEVAMDASDEPSARWSLANTTGPDDRFPSTLATGDATIGVARNVYEARVPAFDFLPVGGLRPGIVWEDLRASSIQIRSENCCIDGEPITYIRSVDEAPNEGPIDHQIAYGSTFTPHLLVWSPTMLRASNGGATTIVYPLHIEAERGRVELSAEDVPIGWDVAIPLRELEGIPNPLVVPIIVTADFPHQHGTMETFTLRATDGIDTATTVLGVHYLDEPQPAGHHPRLFIHAIPRGDEVLELVGQATFNDFSHDLILSTLQTHPQAEDEPQQGAGGYFAGADSPGVWEWTIPLDPVLSVGLAPDTSVQGQLTATFDGAAPGRGRVLGEILRTDGSAVEQVFEILPSDEFDVGNGPIDVTSIVRASMDEALPYKPGMNLLLRLWFYGNVTGAGLGPDERLDLMPGASMRLPLGEYHDPVASFLPKAKAGFENDIDQLFMAPGERHQTTVALTNEGPPDSFRLFASSSPPERIYVTPTEVRLQESESTTIHVVVDAHGLSDGSIIGTVAVLSSSGEASFASVVAEVDPMSNRASTREEKSTPAVPNWLLVFLVAVGAAGRRARTTV